MYRSDIARLTSLSKRKLNGEEQGSDGNSLPRRLSSLGYR